MPVKHSPTKGITSTQVREIKALLWSGKTQIKTAVLTGISQATISRISSGELHPDITWPNGATGSIPNKDTSATMAWSDDMMEYLRFPDEMQLRILEMVNKDRSLNDLEPILTQAPEYKLFMQLDTTDRIMEDLSDYDARKAEDRRVILLMQCWKDLLSEKRLAHDSREIHDIFLSTASSLTRSSTPTTKRTSAEPLTYKKLEWSYICLKAPKISIIKQALLSNNIFMIEAICIIFFELDSVPSWKDDSTEDAIYALMIKLQDHIPTATRIIEENK